MYEETIPQLLRSSNRLKLGTFSWNLERGATPTLAEGSIATLNWPQQVRIAQASEAAGLDAIIPVGRWKGVAGESRCWRESYDTIAWAAALAALTKRISIFSTVHVPLLHPVRAAKNAVTIDHISAGRFGFNIVAGWNEAEFKMFGRAQLPHDERYEQSAEWVQFVRKLWTETESFDWKSKHYISEDAISEPRPLGPKPVMMSAGSSPAGCEFAAEYADIVFISATELTAVREKSAYIKHKAAGYGRSVQVWISGGVLCCETESEADSQYDYFVHQKGDWTAAELLGNAYLSGGGQSVSGAQRRLMSERTIAWMHAYHLKGTPEQVTARLVELMDAGIDGVALVWVDFEEGLRVFDAKLKPLLRQAGLMAEDATPPKAPAVET